MPDYEVFANSPVEEAIISLRLRTAIEPWAFADPLASALGARYPVVERIETGTQPPPEKPDGIRLLSPDRQQAVQLTPEWFSFHRLRPYSRWESFAGEARDAWNCFTQTFDVAVVSDVRLRYLNAFRLPLPFDEWDDFRFFVDFVAIDHTGRPDV